MAKLITSHDPFHVHKILGFFSILHFFARSFLLVYRGYGYCTVDNVACSSPDVRGDVLGALLHGCLSWSSLLFHIPKKRNYNSPMIWPEMRWHSIIFATRSVVGCVVSILGLWPEQWLANYMAKLAVVLGTCYAADVATAKVGCTEKRTTNVMAYPSHITPYMQKWIKLNYSLAQFLGTLSCVSQDPDFAMIPLAAIQGAAFLMTLCRKNIIQTQTVHCAYMLQIAVPMYLPFLAIWHRGRDYAVLIYWLGVLHLVQKYLRIDLRISKYCTWPIVILLLNLVTQWPVLWNVLLWTHTNPYALAFVIFGHLNENHKTLLRYVPMFTKWSYTEEPDILEDYVIMAMSACYGWLKDTIVAKGSRIVSKIQKLIDNRHSPKSS